MAFLKFRIRKKTKLILQSALFFFLLFSPIILGYYYTRNYIIDSDKQIKALVIDYLHERNIDITFDDIKTNVFWRPSIVLSNVHLTHRTPQIDYDLCADKVKVSLSYKILFNRIKIYRLSIFESNLYIDLKDTKSKVSTGLPPQKILIPEYIESYRGKVIIENKTKYYSVAFKDFDFKLFTPKKYLSYLEMKGHVPGNKLFKYPVFFSLKGVLDLNTRSIIGENLDLSLDSYAAVKQYKVDTKFNLNWNLAQNKLSINEFKFTGTESFDHINYKGHIGKINWVNYQQVLIPKINININQSKGNIKTSGYLILNNSSCMQRVCLIDNISFGTTYSSFKNKSFVVNGNAMMDLNLDEYSVTLKHLIFNSEQIKETGSVVPLWALNLKGYLFYRLNDYFLLDLDGLLDRQVIRILIENTSENHQKEKIWKVLVNLDSFDLKPYVKEISNDSLVKIYDSILAKIPRVFELLRDQQLKMKFGIKQLKFPAFIFTDISGNLTHNGNHIQLTHLKGKFFEGDFLTNLEIKLDKSIQYKLEQELNNLNLGVMLFWVTNFPFLSGNGNSYLSLQTEGNNVAEILAHLNGLSSLEIYQGTILGYNLENIIYSQGKLTPLNSQVLAKVQNDPREEFKKTQFDLLKFVNYWTNGIGESVSLEIDGPQFQVRGKGTTNLINKSLNYSLLLSGYLNKNQRRVNVLIPFRLVGDLFAPQYYLDSKQVLELLEDSKNKEQVLKEFLQQQWELMR